MILAISDMNNKTKLNYWQYYLKPNKVGNNSLGIPFATRRREVWSLGLQSGINIEATHVLWHGTSRAGT